jgi:hypothetical protein
MPIDGNFQQQHDNELESISKLNMLTTDQSLTGDPPHQNRPQKGQAGFILIEPWA